MRRLFTRGAAEPDGHKSIDEFGSWYELAQKIRWLGGQIWWKFLKANFEESRLCHAICLAGLGLVLSRFSVQGRGTLEDRMMEFFHRLQRSHGERPFHISDVRHACDKAGEGGDYWSRR
jgi:hypothetical protein